MLYTYHSKKSSIGRKILVRITVFAFVGCFNSEAIFLVSLSLGKIESESMGMSISHHFVIFEVCLHY